MKGCFLAVARFPSGLAPAGPQLTGYLRKREEQALRPACPGGSNDPAARRMIPAQTGEETRRSAKTAKPCAAGCLPFGNE